MTRTRRVGGMTLLELVAAMAILALILTLARVTVDGVTPRWRLRAAAHTVEGVVRWAQNAAVGRGRAVQLLYDVPEGSYWVRIGEESHELHALPGGVLFGSVAYPNGIEVSKDVAAAAAYADGTLDAHTVTLINAVGERAILSFNRLTGELTYTEKSLEER